MSGTLQEYTMFNPVADDTTNDALNVEVVRLETKLDAQWQWFRNNPEHKGGQYHEVFIRTLRRYMAAYDRWYAAENGVG